MFNNIISLYIIYILVIISVILGILVIVSKNPIFSVLFLIGLFLTVSLYLMLLGLNFIGLSYLLVYVGAVSILFLFILMLINVRISELVTDNNNSMPLAAVIGIIFYLTLYKLLSPNVVSEGLYNLELNTMSNDSSNTDIKYALNNILNFNNNDLYFISSQAWDGILSETSDITTICNINILLCSENYNEKP